MRTIILLIQTSTDIDFLFMFHHLYIYTVYSTQIRTFILNKNSNKYILKQSIRITYNRHLLHQLIFIRFHIIQIHKKFPNNFISHICHHMTTTDGGNIHSLLHIWTNLIFFFSKRIML